MSRIWSTDFVIEMSFYLFLLILQIVRAFLPDMQSSNHGHIVSIASLAGQVGVNRLTDYCGTKYGAVGFAEALALELYQEGSLRSFNLEIHEEIREKRKCGKVFHLEKHRN